jgi:hypothetical protein
MQHKKESNHFKLTQMMNKELAAMLPTKLVSGLPYKSVHVALHAMQMMTSNYAKMAICELEHAPFPPKHLSILK